MRKFAFLIRPLVGLALFLYGCQAGGRTESIEKSTRKTGLQESSDGPVLTVAGETITSGEIIMAATEPLKPIAQGSNYERFRQQAKPQLEEVITIRISNILLYQQAKENTAEGIEQVLERPAEAEVRKFLVGFGGDYIKAEQALKRQGMDWADFKEYQKKMILTEYYASSQLPKTGPVTYSELRTSYDRMKDEFFAIAAAIKLRLIDIEPADLQIADPNQDRLEQARRLADELLKRARAGKEFLELAEEYPGVSFAAHSKPVQPESLKYQILAQEAEKLEPGDIAGPIETARQEHIFIMELEEKHSKSYQPFEKVQREVRAKIISDHRKQAQDKILAELRRRAEAKLSSEFTEFCLQTIYRRSVRTPQESNPKNR